jgi:outer membrane protein assembly factor BamB
MGQALSPLNGEHLWAYSPFSSSLQWATTQGVAIGSDDACSVAFDATGHELWRSNRLKILGVGGGRVFAVDGTDMIAIKAANREPLWHASGHSSHVEADDDIVILGGNDYGTVFALDAATGRERWRSSRY